MPMRSGSVRYLVAVLTTACGLAVRAALGPFFDVRFPFLPFYPAVVLSAWFGGFWPGVLCTVFSAGVADYFWFEPIGSMRISAMADVAAVAIFIAIGVIISALSESMRRRQAREREAREAAIGSARELTVLKDRLATEVADMTRLHELSTRLLKEEDLASSMHYVLEASVRALSADNGHVQLVEDGKPTRIVAHVGFTQEFLDRFDVAPARSSISSLVLQGGERVIVEDVFAHPQFANVAPICATHGFVSGQSTPLMNGAGTIVGILSTHFLRPHRPSERELRMLELHVRLAERVIERSRTIEREQAARASAEAASHAKDEFLAVVSHELRAPLNAVLGWAEMLRDGVLDDHRRERALDVIYSNAKRQRQLIDELLDVGRIMSGKVRLERAPIDLESIVRAGVEIVQPAAEAKHLRLTVDVDPLPGPFYGDVARLQQILGNLLSNAIKFTPDAGSIEVRVRRTNGVIEIAVADSGIGIARDFLPFVFEPFHQADGSTTRRHGGLGLGLSIVRHLVEAHAGSVAVESAGNGRGATFTIRLPVVSVYQTGPESPMPPPGIGQMGHRASLNGVIALIVDDDADSRDVIVACLESSGATALTASSASEALSMLRRHSIDVLLADIAMPGEDGYSLMRKVRALEGASPRPIPAVALTAYAREDDRQMALEAGFTLHLPKPVDSVALVDAVSRVHVVQRSH